MAGPTSHKVHAADSADPARAHGEPNGMRLRLARQARGFSQQQLAGMAGVSRQAVSAVESGLSDPSLRVALALARALGLTVEEMFGPRAPAPQVDAQPLSPLGDGGGRVTLAAIGGTLVALPLSGAAVSKAGFVPADGIAGSAGPAPADPAGTGGPGHSIRPLSPPRPTLVVAGCDPAIPLLEAPLGLLDPPVSLAWWQCASGEALDLAARGLVHVAGAHLRGREGDYNVGSARATLRRGAQIMGFCSWREGLVLRSGLAAQVSSVADVVRAGLRLVNREPGSEARLLLDRELAALGAAPPGTGARPRATCTSRRPSPPGWPTWAWPVSRPRSPMAWTSSRSPKNGSIWSSRPTGRVRGKRRPCSRCCPRAGCSIS
jgi:putative molybdopterin biosynthesis protein